MLLHGCVACCRDWMASSAGPTALPSDRAAHLERGPRRGMRVRAVRWSQRLQEAAAASTRWCWLRGVVTFAMQRRAVLCHAALAASSLVWGHGHIRGGDMAHTAVRCARSSTSSTARSPSPKWRAPQQRGLGVFRRSVVVASRIPGHGLRCFRTSACPGERKS